MSALHMPPRAWRRRTTRQDRWLAAAAAFASMHIAMTWALALRRGLRARRREIAPLAGPATWPTASVIVPAWNERALIETCLHGLRSVTYPDFEAIIVAGGPDGTYQAAMAASRDLPNVRVLEQEARGKNAALDKGLAAARGDVIALLDADCEVVPAWLSALVAPISDPSVATTGQVMPRRRTAISTALQMEMIEALQIAGATRVQGAASIGLHRTAIERIGGFPEDVLVGVDWDLDVRLAAIGVRRVFCPDAVVTTEIPATLREYWRSEVRWRRAHLASLWRHRAHFLGSPRTALSSLYMYGLAWGVAVGTVVVIAGDVTAVVRSRAALTGLWFIAVGWLSLRRAALAAEVAAFRRDPAFLRVAWAPPLLLGITFAAVVQASLTVKRIGPHFKGPRPTARHAR